LIGATAVFLLHGLVDIDLRFPPNHPLLWLLLGLLASGEDYQPLRISLRQTAMRVLLAVALVFGAGYVALYAIVQPMRADWADRQAQLAEDRAIEARERGDGTDMVREFQSAAFTAQNALEIQPLRLTTRYFLAGILSQLPTSEARSQAIEQSLFIEEIAPDYADITFNLGQLYLSSGDFPRALPYLERAVHINPYNFDKRIQLAIARAGLDQRDAARLELEAALRLNPENKQAQLMLANLQREDSP
jgi:tetratricopeptide (TPR) repeat protein